MIALSSRSAVIRLSETASIQACAHVAHCSRGGYYASTGNIDESSMEPLWAKPLSMTVLFTLSLYIFKGAAPTLQFISALMVVAFPPNFGHIYDFIHPTFIFRSSLSFQ